MAIQHIELIESLQTVSPFSGRRDLHGRCWYHSRWRKLWPGPHQSGWTTAHSSYSPTPPPRSPLEVGGFREKGKRTEAKMERGKEWDREGETLGRQWVEEGKEWGIQWWIEGEKIDEEKWRVEDESQGQENEAHNATVRGAEQTLSQIGLLTSINFTQELNLIAHKKMWIETSNLSFRHFPIWRQIPQNLKFLFLGYSKKHHYSLSFSVMPEDGFPSKVNFMHLNIQEKRMWYNNSLCYSEIAPVWKCSFVF